MRLDRYVSQGTGTPRRETLQHVRHGLVRVDGRIVKDPGAQVVVGRDEVTLRGQIVRPPGHLLLAMHKPAGYVTSTEDGVGPIVMDLVPEPYKRRDLAPVGRLDKDTTGLLLLTTDGGLNHALTHPRRHVDKAYVVTLEAPLPDSAEARFAQGVVLADGTVCKPAGLERLDPLHVRVILREGRYHQVKRMIAACGGGVVGLHRERIGGLVLDQGLPPGQVRPLTTEEARLLGVDIPSEDDQ